MIRTLSWQVELHKMNSFPDIAGAAENRDIILAVPDAKEWLQITPGDLFAGRRRQQNILRDISEPTPYGKRILFAGSPASAWRLLVDNFILKHITKCTVTDAHRQLHN